MRVLWVWEDSPAPCFSATLAKPYFTCWGWNLDLVRPHSGRRQKIKFQWRRQDMPGMQMLISCEENIKPHIYLGACFSARLSCFRYFKERGTDKTQNERQRTGWRQVWGLTFLYMYTHFSLFFHYALTPTSSSVQMRSGGHTKVSTRCHGESCAWGRKHVINLAPVIKTDEMGLHSQQGQVALNIQNFMNGPCLTGFSLLHAC